MESPWNMEPGLVCDEDDNRTSLSSFSPSKAKTRSSCPSIWTRDPMMKAAKNACLTSEKAEGKECVSASCCRTTSGANGSRPQCPIPLNHVKQSEANGSGDLTNGADGSGKIEGQHLAQGPRPHADPKEVDG